MKNSENTCEIIYFQINDPRKFLRKELYPYLKSTGLIDNMKNKTFNGNLENCKDLTYNFVTAFRNN